MSQRDEARIGTLLSGKYRITRILGKGGMGVVYAAEHEKLKRKAAIKFLHPYYAEDSELLARFFAEAQAASRLRHPNVIDIYDLDVDEDNSPYMILEYLDGESLGERLERGPLSVEYAVQVLAPVLDALQTAHDAGIVHRDLKPENIFIGRGPKGGLMPKVLDFGIAKLTNSGDAASSTRTGTVVGTPAYMAPEQALDGKSVTALTDLWAMGVVAFESLTGGLPFDFHDGMTPTAVLMCICSETPKRLAEVMPHLPPNITQAVDMCLQRDLDKRMDSARTFRKMVLGEVDVMSAMRPTTPPTGPTIGLGGAEPSQQFRVPRPGQPTPSSGHHALPQSGQYSANEVTGPTMAGAQAVGAVGTGPIPMTPGMPVPGHPLPTNRVTPTPYGQPQVAHPHAMAPPEMAQAATTPPSTPSPPSRSPWMIAAIGLALLGVGLGVAAFFVLDSNQSTAVAPPPPVGGGGATMALTGAGSMPMFDPSAMRAGDPDDPTAVEPATMDTATMDTATMDTATMDTATMDTATMESEPTSDENTSDDPSSDPTEPDGSEPDETESQMAASTSNMVRSPMRRVESDMSTAMSTAMSPTMEEPPTMEQPAAMDATMMSSMMSRSGVGLGGIDDF